MNLVAGQVVLEATGGSECERNPLATHPIVKAKRLLE